MLCECGGQTANLQAVLEALRASGVEVLEDGLRLVPKRKRLTIPAELVQHGAT
jgi:hypothetical protein